MVYLLAFLLACAPAAAWAASQDRVVIRDERGTRVGTVEQGIGGRQIIRDSQGNRVGTVEPGIGGRQVIRDERGKRVGTIEGGTGAR